MKFSIYINYKFYKRAIKKRYFFLVKNRFYYRERFRRKTFKINLQRYILIDLNIIEKILK